MSPAAHIEAIHRAIYLRLAEWISNDLELRVVSCSARLLFTFSVSLICNALLSKFDSVILRVASQVSLIVTTSVVVRYVVVSHGHSFPLVFAHLCVIMEGLSIVAPLVFGSVSDSLLSQCQYLLAVNLSGVMQSLYSD